MRFVCRQVIIICLGSVLLPAVCLAAELAGYASVSGYVKDSITQVPLNQARVRLRCGITRLSATANASGYYEFPEIPIYQQGKKTYRNKTLISVSAPEYRTKIKRTKLLPGESYTFDFFLNPRFRYPIVQGRVTDSQTTEGITEATVTISNENKTYSGITNENGNYIIRVKNRRVGYYTVIAAAEGYLDSEPQSLQTFPSQTYILDFSLEKAGLSVDVSPDYWHIGEKDPNTITTMSAGEKITVTNTGNTNQTYSLMLINPPGWTASEAGPGNDQYILNASFASSVDNIVWNESNHALLSIAQRATETKFAGDQSGVDTAPDAERLLWLQFKAPTSTSIANEQEIKVVINAEQP